MRGAAGQKAEQASAEAQAASVRVQRTAKDVKATADRIQALSIKLMAWLHAHSRHRVGSCDRYYKKPVVGLAADFLAARGTL
jgi:hypothetical protein